LWREIASSIQGKQARNRRRGRILS
jgi:hypothetical protein